MVENRPGAAAAIAAGYVAAAKPDGYTLYYSAPELAVLPAVRKVLPFSAESFTYLIRPFAAPSIVLASPKLGVTTLEGLVDHMRKNPGRVRYGTPGVGHFVHLGTAKFEREAGVTGVHVPYTGIAPVYADLMAGNVDITLGASIPFLDGLTVLGSSGSKRHPVYPNLPTLEELGYKGVGLDVWFQPCRSCPHTAGGHGPAGVRAERHLQGSRRRCETHQGDRSPA